MPASVSGSESDAGDSDNNSVSDVDDDNSGDEVDVVVLPKKKVVPTELDEDGEEGELEGADEEEEVDVEADDGGLDEDNDSLLGLNDLGLEENAEEEDGEDNDDDDDDDDDDDEAATNCMQKFDAQTRSEIITESHPETISHTTEEIQCLSKVTRDTYGDIVDELHQTTAILTKFERTRVVGLRTRQLNAGAPPFIDVPRTIISNMVIALMELQQKKLPFIIQRPLSGGKFEYWRVNDLELLD
jgi:DNA-directed RNA polymerase subunit K/omega